MLVNYNDEVFLLYLHMNHYTRHKIKNKKVIKHDDLG